MAAPPGEHLCRLTRHYFSSVLLQTAFQQECAEIRKSRDRLRFPDIGVGELDAVFDRRITVRRDQIAERPGDRVPRLHFDRQEPWISGLKEKAPRAAGRAGSRRRIFKNSGRDARSNSRWSKSRATRTTKDRSRIGFTRTGAATAAA